MGALESRVMDRVHRVPPRPPARATKPADPDLPDGPGDGDADETAADEARRRYQSELMTTLGPDAQIAPLLAPAEKVLAVRRCAGFEQRPACDAAAVHGRGDLYLTSARLVLVAQPMIEIGLEQIDEAMLCSARLLLVLHDGAGIALEVEGPHLLRVEIAAARAAARR